MSRWYYFNKSGERVGPITSTALKLLTQQGVISRETVLENHNGRTAVASQVNGLEFPTLLDTAPKLTIVPSGSGDVYGLELASPPPPPKPQVERKPTSRPPTGNSITITPPVLEKLVVVNPFTASMPVAESSSRIDLPVEEKPLSASFFVAESPVTIDPSTVENPFSAPPPAEDKPLTDESASIDPFTSPVPAFADSLTAASPMSNWAIYAGYTTLLAPLWYVIVRVTGIVNH